MKRFWKLFTQALIAVVVSLAITIANAPPLAYADSVDLYWVQVAGTGNGTWGDIAHWGTASGGAGGHAVPTFTNKVIFDGNSFNPNELFTLGMGIIAGNITAAETTNTTTHSFVIPPALKDDLMVMTISSGNTIFTFPLGWTQLVYTAHPTDSAVALAIWYKLADGTESGSIGVNSTTSVLADTNTYYIRGATGIEIGISANGSTTTPDPPNMSPSWNSTSATIWIPVMSAVRGGDYSVSSYPAGYTNGIFSHFTNGPGVATANKTSTAVSENPGTFTLNIGCDWVANTIAVKVGNPISAVAATIDWSTVNSTPVWAGTSPLSIYGSFISGNYTHSFSGPITWASTTSGNNITSGSHNWTSTMSFNGTGGGWALQDAFNIGTNTITLTNGGLNTNGVTVTSGTFTTTTGTNNLTLGSTIWNNSGNWIGTTLGTFNANTSSLRFTGASTTFTGASKTYYDVQFLGSGSPTISESDTFTNLTRVGTAIAGDTLIVNAAQTITGNLTLTGNSQANRLALKSNTTIARIMTAGNTSVTNCDFYYINGQGTANWNFRSNPGGSADMSGNVGLVLSMGSYWVGGPGTGYDATHVSGTSGGPANGDWLVWTGVDLRVDSNSGMSGQGIGATSFSVRSLDLTGSGCTGLGVTDQPATPHGTTITGNITMAGGSLSYGDNSIDANGAWSIGMAGQTTYISMGGGKISASASNSFSFGAGTIVLLDAFSDTAGSLFSVSVGGSTTLNISSSLSCIGAQAFGNAGIINAGSSTITVYAWSNTGTFNAGTSSIIVTSGGFAGGTSQTYYNVTLQVAVATAHAITGSNTLTNLTIAGAAATSTNSFPVTFSASQVITGNFTVTGSNSYSTRVRLASSVSGTQRVIYTLGPVPVITNTDISDIQASVVWNIASGLNTDYGNNLNIIFTPPASIFWVGNTGTWSDPSHWATVTGGTGGTGHVPLAQDIGVFDSHSFTLPLRVVTLDTGLPNISGIDASNVTNNPTISGAGTFNFYGDIHLGTIVWSVTTTNLVGFTDSTVISNSVFITNFQVSKSTTTMASVKAGGNFGISGSLTLLSGTLDLQGFIVTANNFDASTTTSTRALNMNSGTMTLNGTGVITKWNLVLTNFTNNPSPFSTIWLSNNSTSAQTFAGGGLGTYGNLKINGGGNYTMTITGNNAFNTLTIDRSQAAKTLSGAVTMNVTAIAIPPQGTTIVAITNTDFIMPSGLVITDYLNLTGSNASGGATYYAGSHSTNGSGNSGWIFTDFAGATPNATTNSASLIGQTTAQLNATLATIGSFAPVYGYFQYDLTGTYVSPTTTPLITLNANGPYAQNVTGLNTDTTYHYRALVLYNGYQVFTGNDTTFLTLGAPIPVTGSAAAVTYTTVTLQGVLSSLGSYSATYVYFEYGTNTSYGTTTVLFSMSSVASFTQAISGLTANTTYHFRMDLQYTRASTGTTITVTGADSMFNTLSLVAPTILTGAATSINQTNTTLQGSLVNMGSYTTVVVSFEYGLTTGYGTATAPQTETMAISFSAPIGNLQQSQTYHFRANANYGTGLVVHGSDVTFTMAGNGLPGTNPPDILTVEDAKVVSGYMAAGDQLYLVSYKAIYLDGNPAAPASDYFVIQLLNNGAIVGQWSLPSWGFQPVGLYLSPNSALPYGGLYTVKIVGITSKWPVPPIPSATRVLSSGDWLGADLTQLDNWVLQTARSIGSYYNTELLTYTATGTVLNNIGGALFNTNISGLSQIRPQLFNAYASRPNATNTPSSNTSYTDTWNPSERLGPYINTLLQEGATTMNMDQIAFNNLLGIGLWALIVIILLIALRGSFMAALIAAPMLVGISWCGLLIPQIIVVLAVVNVTLLAYALLPRGTG